MPMPAIRHSLPETWRIRSGAGAGEHKDVDQPVVSSSLFLAQRFETWLRQESCDYLTALHRKTRATGAPGAALRPLPAIAHAVPRLGDGDIDSTPHENDSALCVLGPLSSCCSSISDAMATLTASFFVMLLLWAEPSCEGGRVLVYPVDASHWLNMQVLVEGLHTRGHQVTVLRSSASWYIAELSPHYTSITVPQDTAQGIESADLMSRFLHRSLELRKQRGSPLAFLAFYSNLFNFVMGNNRIVAHLARTMFEDQALMKELREAHFDLVLTDPTGPIGVMLAHHLQVPLVLNVRWALSSEGHFVVGPSPLSYVPQVLSVNTDRMDFWQRISNILYHGISLYLYHFVSIPPYQALCEEFFPPGMDAYSLIQGADLWLMRVDFVFEFPRPTMPNLVYVGGFPCHPAQALPPELEEFMQSSGEHGVVLMSLGSLLRGLQPHVSDIIASAFARLPQKVVWRHLDPRPTTLGNNTLLLDWLPQNDLLGHPKTRAFVTHGGTNGLYEAIYHGVPVVGLPLIFDQMDNMVRMEARGAGITLDVTSLEVDSLTQALRDVLDEQKPYRENMRRLSRLHRDRPIEPLDSALFWMEFVMRHGGAAHLRTESYKMPWYAYHNVDVLAFLLGSVLALLLLISATCRCLFQRLCKRRKVKLQ